MFWIFEQCAPGNELNNVAVVSLRHLHESTHVTETSQQFWAK